MKIVEPAYDDEIGISFDTMRVMRKAQTLKLTDKETKIEARGYYNKYLEWSSGLSEMKDYTAKVDVGGFHLDQEYMDRIMLDGRAQYDEEKLNQQGYSVVKDRNYSQTFFIQPMDQTKRYPQEGDFRYEYSSSKYGNGSTVTVIGRKPKRRCGKCYYGDHTPAGLYPWRNLPFDIIGRKTGITTAIKKVLGMDFNP